ncbi:MAG: filamentous hemagglutinin N-terminal domain-containing protein [Calothrix sp. SM1_7_51]|nr:filamentous hemagglutinin N-terminal domain-containing protein [Calothrix sp. SM1_7_51]
MKRFFVKKIILNFSIPLIFLSSQPVSAQIVPDATLPVNSVVKQEGSNSQIEGGTVRDNHLFHSFQEFSVLTKGTAIFNNDLNIQNIFTRVKRWRII